MGLIVQKYGGTSMGDAERIGIVADRVCRARAAGHQVIVVVSAMAGETDRLIALARGVCERPPAREMDVLLSTGEQVSIALLAMALEQREAPACSFTGPQVGIRTDSVHSKARIRDIDAQRIRATLAEGRTVVVAGFQGMDEVGDITTLGRGGSDTTAVALAAALKADECQIYTDVDGVYTTDPRVVANARRLERITFEEMLEMASLGAKVLQIRAVEFAGKYQVPLRVLSTFEDGPGTLITLEDDYMEDPLVSGIAFNRDEAEITVRGVPDQPGIAYAVLGPVAQANIEVDMIIQAEGEDGLTNLTFTVHANDYEQAVAIVEAQRETLGARSVGGNLGLAKISLVGVGMRSHAGVAARAFEALAKERINIHTISTSEIKISLVVEGKYLELGVRALHDAFGLSDAPQETQSPLA